MIALYLFAGMVTFWSVVLTLIFRLEKRMVWPYGELEPQPAFQDSTGYGETTIAAASAAGFRLQGWSRDLKGRIYRVNYAMLSSREGDVFAIVGIGTIAGIPLRATWLFTRTSDCRCFYSADHQSAVQIDPSSHWKTQLVPAAPFERLLQEHRQWIAASPIVALPFTKQHEIEELRAARVEHYRSMERAGMINFTDASLSHFHFTLFGAMRVALQGYFLGMARKLTFGRFPRTA